MILYHISHRCYYGDSYFCVVVIVVVVVVDVVGRSKTFPASNQSAKYALPRQINKVQMIFKLHFGRCCVIIIFISPNLFSSHRICIMEYCVKHMVYVDSIIQHFTETTVYIGTSLIICVYAQRCALFPATSVVLSKISYRRLPAESNLI